VGLKNCISQGSARDRELEYSLSCRFLPVIALCSCNSCSNSHCHPSSSSSIHYCFSKVARFSFNFVGYCYFVSYEGVSEEFNEIF
jgi:hypothetical protein